MFTNLTLCLLIVVGVYFFIYESLLHQKYKKDLQNEKLISFFSNARMQLMRMLYMKEITPGSCYFNFMIHATSYSIRTIYFSKGEVLSLQQITPLEKMLQFLNTETIKKEFQDLNSEQKELFAKTVLNIIKLYFNKELIKRMLLKLYFFKASCKVLSCIIKILEKMPKNEKSQELSYINNLDKSYDLSRYTLA